MAGPRSSTKRSLPNESTSPSLFQSSQSKKYLAFDIEIANDLPAETDDWTAARPLGIACAATLTSEGELIRWHGRTGDGDISTQMTLEESQQMVIYLQEAAQNGYTVCTWNGLGFDFDILGEESGMVSQCRDLALNHVDMMFHFFCLKGFAVGLDKVARGMGLPGKHEGISGALVPQMWRQGQHQKVLEYVAQDVRTTLAIAQATEAGGRIRWISSRGGSNQTPLSGWLTVRDALALPLPDVSWLNKPWPRSKFLGWTGLDAETQRRKV